MSLFRLLETWYSETSSGNDPHFLHDEHGKHLTVRQTYEMVCHLAQLLLEKGVQPGKKLAIAVDRSVAQPLLELAAGALNCSFLPIDVTGVKTPENVAASTALLLENSVDYVIAEPAVLMDSQTQALANSDKPVVKWQELLLQADERQQTATTEGTALVSPGLTPVPDQISHSLASSGSTTGKPVMMHVPLGALEAWEPDLPALLSHIKGDGTDHYLSLNNFGFDAHLAPLMHALKLRTQLTIASQETLVSKERMQRLIRINKITDILCLPSEAQFYRLDQLLGEHGDTRCALRSLQTVGEPFDRDYAEFLARDDLFMYTLFGSTEGGLGYAGTRITKAILNDSDGAVPIGQPMSGAKFWVLVEEGENKWRQAQPGEEGELFVEKPHMIAGYPGNPERTAEKFVTHELDGRPRRLFREGELVVKHKDGQYYSKGRIGLTAFKTHGIKVWVEPTEDALKNHPKIKDAKIVLAPQYHARRNKPFTAVIQYEPDASPLEVEEVETFLRAQKGIYAYTVPTFLVSLPSALPQTASGKVDRRALAALVGPQSQWQPVPPMNTMQSELRDIFHGFLSATDYPTAETVCCAKSFLLHGGDSRFYDGLLEAVSEHYEATGASVSLNDFTADFPMTIQNISLLLQARKQEQQRNPAHTAAKRESLPVLVRWAASPSSQERASKGNLPPIFLLPGITGNDVAKFSQMAKKLAARLGRDVYVLRDPTHHFGPQHEYSMDKLCQMYREAMRQVQPNGKLSVGGWSFGCDVAWRLAVAEEKAGTPMQLLALLDGDAPHLPDEVVRAGEFSAALNRAYLERVFSLLAQVANTYSQTGQGNITINVSVDDFTPEQLAIDPKRLIRIIFDDKHKVSATGDAAIREVCALRNNLLRQIEFSREVIHKLKKTTPVIAACRRAEEARPNHLWWEPYAGAGYQAIAPFNASHEGLLADDDLLEFLCTHFEKDEAQLRSQAQPGANGQPLLTAAAGINGAVDAAVLIQLVQALAQQQATNPQARAAQAHDSVAREPTPPLVPLYQNAQRSVTSSTGPITQIRPASVSMVATDGSSVGARSLASTGSADDINPAVTGGSAGNGSPIRRI